MDFLRWDNQYDLQMPITQCMGEPHQRLTERLVSWSSIMPEIVSYTASELDQR